MNILYLHGMGGGISRMPNKSPRGRRKKQEQN